MGHTRDYTFFLTQSYALDKIPFLLFRSEEVNSLCCCKPVCAKGLCLTSVMCRFCSFTLYALHIRFIEIIFNNWNEKGLN